MVCMVVGQDHIFDRLIRERFDLRPKLPGLAREGGEAGPEVQADVVQDRVVADPELRQHQLGEVERKTIAPHDRGPGRALP